MLKQHLSMWKLSEGIYLSYYKIMTETLSRYKNVKINYLILPSFILSNFLICIFAYYTIKY